MAAACEREVEKNFGGVIEDEGQQIYTGDEYC